MVHNVDNAIERLCSFLYRLCGIAIFFMMAITCLDVGMRFFAQSPLGGSIELTEITMFLILFFGLAKIQFSESHISVDLMVDKLPLRAREGISLFVSLLTAMLAVLMVWYMSLSFLDKLETGEYTPALFLKLSIFIGFGILGCAAFTLAAFRNICMHLSAMRSDKALILLALVAAVLFAAVPFSLHDTEFSYDYAKVGFLCIGILIFLILLKISIAAAMCITGIIGLMIISLTPLQGLNVLLSMPSSTMNYSYSVIPMFVLMGEFVLHAKIGEALFSACSLWLGQYPGGLAIAGLSGCAGFSAICGDSLATALTMTSVALPEMKRYKYNSAFSSACLAAGGTLGILIPPSVGFIFYAIVTEQSIGRLFLAGFLPGFTLLLLFCIMTCIISIRHPELAPKRAPVPLKEKVRSLYQLIPMIGLIVFMLGGMFGGIFSPTEAGAVGAGGTFIYALCRRSLSWKNFTDSLFHAADICVKCTFILLGVSVLGAFLATTQLPFMLADMVTEMNTNRYVVLAGIVLMYIGLGCLFNVVPMILLTLPAIFPTVQACGFDPIWFGVITVLLMEMGQITPPVGIIVFAISGMEGAAPMGMIFRHVMPYIFCILICVVIMAIFPEIVLYLPDKLM